MQKKSHLGHSLSLVASSSYISVSSFMAANENTTLSSVFYLIFTESGFIRLSSSLPLQKSSSFHL
nr:MAG TPA: hypothetical protein [Caudoviricetes sp.]